MQVFWWHTCKEFNWNTCLAFASIFMPFKTPCYWGKEFHLNVCRHFCDSLFSHYHSFTFTWQGRQCYLEKMHFESQFKFVFDDKISISGLCFSGKFMECVKTCFWSVWADWNNLQTCWPIFPRNMILWYSKQILQWLWCGWKMHIL